LRDRQLLLPSRRARRVHQCLQREGKGRSLRPPRPLRPLRETASARPIAGSPDSSTDRTQGTQLDRDTPGSCFHLAEIAEHAEPAEPTEHRVARASSLLCAQWNLLSPGERMMVRGQACRRSSTMTPPPGFPLGRRGGDPKTERGFPDALLANREQPSQFAQPPLLVRTANQYPTRRGPSSASSARNSLRSTGRERLRTRAGLFPRATSYRPHAVSTANREPRTLHHSPHEPQAPHRRPTFDEVASTAAKAVTEGSSAERTTKGAQT
jgi:hypothetical protein